MIRSIIMSLLLFLPANALAAIDYNLDVALIPAEQRLVATAQITPDASLGRQVELRLSGKCKLIAIKQAGSVLPYSFSGDSLKIRLNSQAPFSISYEGRFNDPVADTPAHNEDPGYAVSASISAAGTFLSATAGWYPRLDSENIIYHIRITAPAGMEAITSGRRIERRTSGEQTQSTWMVDYPLRSLTLSAGEYLVFEGSAGTIPIYAYFYAKSKKLAQTYLQEARSYLQLYEQLFGPYPFHKFAIVENFFPTGYGLPSWTLLGSSVIRLPFIVKTSLGHEIAHSWWGAGVWADYRQGNWTEGLTTYVADYLFKEQSSAEEALEYRLKILRDYGSLVRSAGAFPISRFQSRHDKASQAIGYGKVAMLFHMLRKEVGDEIFWSGLKKLAQDKRYKEIGWTDFAEYFSVDSGRDLLPFFKQWITRTEGPGLSLQNVRLQKEADGYSISGELVQTAPYYQLTVTLQVVHEGGSIQVPLDISGQSQAFRFFVSGQPSTLAADPAADLFRILDPEEIPPTVNAIRGSNNLLVVKAKSNVPSPAATKTLLGAYRIAQLPIHDATELSAPELGKHDLLIFGVSDNLNPGMITGEQIQLAGETSDLNGKSAFVVLPNPLNKRHTAAWFVSVNNDLDGSAARKIPHYGKYSYLLFDGSTNRQKGTLAPQFSPLKIEFKQ